MVSIWPILFALFQLSSAYKLDLLHSQNSLSPFNSTSFLPHRRLLEDPYRESTLNPLRILYYPIFNEYTSEAYKARIQELLPIIKEFFKNRLSIYSVKTPFGLQQEDCRDVKLPTDHRYLGFVGDIVIYVANVQSLNGYTMEAVPCIWKSEPRTYILAGRIKIVDDLFMKLSYETQITYLTKMTFYNLGCANWFYKYFTKPDLTPYMSDEITEILTIKGKSVTILKLPTVVTKARQAFQCDTIQGVQLDSSLGSYWKSLYMYNDIMSNTQLSSSKVYTDITFAVLQDSGWYDVNWDNIETITWGKELGCDFFEKSCIENDEPTSNLFCGLNSHRTDCSHDRLYISKCNISQHDPNLPSYYAYFSNPGIGGSDSRMDYCPIQNFFTTGSCQNTNATPNSMSKPETGETVCPNCRCLSSNLLRTDFTSTSDLEGGCYKIRCSDSKYYISVDSQEKECSDGQNLSFPEYRGSIICAPYSEVCNSSFCMHKCLWRGKCVHGLCKCDMGYGGDYCQFMCHSSCFNCYGTDENQCSSCGINQTLKDGRCLCSSSDLSQAPTKCVLKCNSLCEICNINSKCIKCKQNAYSLPSNPAECICEIGAAEKNGQCFLACLNCSKCDPGVKCLKCPVGYIRDLDYPIRCVCDTGYFLQNGKCELICTGLCKTCIDNSFTCTNCVDHSRLDEGNRVCRCDEGYVQYNQACYRYKNSLCEIWHALTECQKCVSGAELDPNDKNKCICSRGYHEESGICAADCLGLCDTCDKNKGDLCISCKIYSQFNSVSQSCECKAQYALLDNQCVYICSSLCKVCDPVIGCTQCIPNALPDPSYMGDCLCSSGYHLDSNECMIDCKGLCNTCEENPSICKTCKEHSYSIQDRVCQCDNEYVSDEYSCFKECNGLCKECASGLCMNCVDGAIAGPDSNGCICKPDYYRYGNICQAKCQSPCKTCEVNDGTKCLSCIANAELQAGECKCTTGYVLLNNICSVSCNLLCAACNSNTGCLQCTSNSTLDPSDSRSCMCKPGYHLVDDTCITLCLSPCLTCSKDVVNHCLSCLPNSSLDPLSNTCICNTGYTMNESKECSPCPSTCQTCWNMIECSTCSYGMVVNSSLRCDCASGFSHIDGKCCPKLCAECDIKEDTECTSCVSNAELSINKPRVCECKVGFIKQGISCEADCNELCIECGVDTGCKRCTEHSEVSSTNLSVCECISGYISRGKECIACNSMCKTCDNHSVDQCITCIDNSALPNSVPGLCECNTGYSLKDGKCIEIPCPDGCLECNYSTMDCISCKTGSFMWKDLKRCYSICASDYNEIKGECIDSKSSMSVLDIYFRYLYTTIEYRNLLVKAINTLPVYKQGLYLNKSGYIQIQGKYILNSEFSLEMWVRPEKSSEAKTLLSKVTSSSVLKIALNTQNTVVVTVISQSQQSHTLEMDGIIPNNSWSSLVLLFSYLNSKTYITLYRDNLMISQKTMPNIYFQDDTSLNYSAISTIGAYKDKTIADFFIGFIASIKLTNSASYSASFSGSCLASDFCLSNCQFMQYWNGNECLDCDVACPKGCLRKTDCRLNVDKLCRSFSDYETCSECDFLANSKENSCRCVDNSSYDISNHSCVCDKSFETSFEKCVSCRNYYRNQEVSAEFSEGYADIVLKFQRELNIPPLDSCDNIIHTESLVLLGTNPICTVMYDKLAITIALGEQPTIKNQKIYLKDQNLIAKATKCTFVSENLEPEVKIIVLPIPGAVIIAPETFSIDCGSDYLNISGVKSYGGCYRNLNYSWNVYGQDLSSPLVEFVSGKTEYWLNVPVALLNQGVITFELTVTNWLNQSHKTSAEILVKNGILLNVLIDVGTQVSIISSERRIFKAWIDNFCNTSVLELSYTWSFIKSTDYLFNPTSFLQSSKSNSLIIIPNSLRSGYSYTFKVTATGLGASGEASLNINVTLPDLIAKFNKVNGIISNKLNLIIDASGSKDPAGCSILFDWSCSEAGISCKGGDDQLLFENEKNSFINITGARMRAGASYFIRLTVSIDNSSCLGDTRQGFSSVELTVIEGEAADISVNIKEKVSHQYPMKIYCFISQTQARSVSYKWTQTTGNLIQTLAAYAIPSILIAKDQMFAGYSYTYIFEVLKNDAVIASAMITWNVNKGPLNGKVVVDPTSGYADKTTFKIIALGFDGSKPLYYTHFMKTQNEKCMLSMYSESPTYSIPLMSTVISVGVIVCDTAPTCIEKSTPVKVQSRSGRYLQNMSIKDEFLQNIGNRDTIPAWVFVYSSSSIDEESFITLLNSLDDYRRELMDFSKYSRQTMYTGYFGLLSQIEYMKPNRVVSIAKSILYMIEMNPQDVLREETDEIVQNFMPFFNTTGNYEFIYDMVDILRSVSNIPLIDTPPDSVPPTNLTDSTWISYRVIASTLSNTTQLFQSFNMTYSTITSSGEDILDIHTMILNSSYELPYLFLTIHSVGKYDGLSIQPDTQRVDIETVRSGIDVEFTGLDLNSEYGCEIFDNYTWIDGNCSYQTQNGISSIGIYNLGLLRFIRYEIVPIEPTEGKNNVTESSKDMYGYGPISCLVSTAGFIGILVTIGTLGAYFKHQKDIKSRLNITHSKNHTPTVLTQNPKLEAENVDETPIDISQEPHLEFEQDYISQDPQDEIDDPDKLPKNSEFKKILRDLHIYYIIFSSDSLTRIQHGLVLLATLTFELAFIGAWGIAMDKQNAPKDMNILGLPISLILGMILIAFKYRITSSIDQFRIILLTVSLIITLLSCISVIIMSFYSSDEDSLDWSINYIQSFFSEMTLFQFMKSYIYYYSSNH